MPQPLAQGDEIHVMDVMGEMGEIDETMITTAYLMAGANLLLFQKQCSDANTLARALRLTAQVQKMLKATLLHQQEWMAQAQSQICDRCSHEWTPWCREDSGDDCRTKTRFCKKCGLEEEQ